MAGSVHAHGPPQELKRKKAKESKSKQEQAKEELCLMPQKKEKAEERKRHRVLSKNESARWVGVLDVELSEITPRKPQYRKTQRERKERPQIWPNPPCIANNAPLHGRFSGLKVDIGESPVHEYNWHSEPVLVENR